MSSDNNSTDGNQTDTSSLGVTSVIDASPPTIPPTPSSVVVAAPVVTITAPTAADLPLPPPPAVSAAVSTETPSVVAAASTTMTTTTEGVANTDIPNSSSGGNSSSTKGVKSVTINGNDRTKDLKEHDVVCEKGRGDHERWPGNKLYRHLINLHKETYNDLPPVERSSIIGNIISSIKEKDGWFVHHSDLTNKWTRLSEEKVRKKVSDDLRREIRRRREKRSHNSVFSAKLRAIKQMEESEATSLDILEPVDDPRPADVLFGPGARRHPGNKTYWNLMKMNLDQYIISPYGARSVISRNIVQCVSNQLGRFLEQDPKTGIWYHISSKRAIEKTSHALSNMKYKTRKTVHPHDPVDFRPLPAGSFDDMLTYDDDDFSEDAAKIMEGGGGGGESPNTVFAKKRTKKFRFLSRRMDDDDDNLTLESKGSLKSAGSLDGLMMLKNHSNLLPATPPAPGMTKLPSVGKLISPNDNSTRASTSDETREDYHEFQEQRNPNNTVSGGYHHNHHHHRGGPVPPPGFPDGSEFSPMTGGYGGNAGAGGGIPPGNVPAADIGPRPSYYDGYIKGYGGGTSGYNKHLPYDYGHLQQHQQHPHHSNMRRYTPPPHEYMMGGAANGAAGGGHHRGYSSEGGHMAGMSQQHPPPPLHHHHHPHHAGNNNNKAVGANGGGGYWAGAGGGSNNEWTSQRMEGYY